MRPERLTRAMEEALAEGVFPGAVLLAGNADAPIYHQSFGKTALDSKSREVTRETYFDLASLTKPLATAGVSLLLIDRGELSLTDPVSRWIPSWGEGERGKVTLAHLLSHSGGLPAWRPFYQVLLNWQQRGEGKIGSEAARRYLCGLVEKEPLVYPVGPVGPVGTKSEYSDLGFILLGEILERVGGKRLDRLASEMIFAPLGIRSLLFNPRETLSEDASIAATEECPWRKRVLIGEVHDDNAFVTGGVAGHAGLFGTTEGVYRLASFWLRGDRGEGPFSPKWVRRFWERSAIPGATFALGWDTPSEPPPPAHPSGSSPSEPPPPSRPSEEKGHYSSCGSRFSRRSVGHLGFTGTSLWIDRDRGVIVVLLTNRVHPTRANEKIRQFRPRIHDLVMEEWER